MPLIHWPATRVQLVLIEPIARVTADATSALSLPAGIQRNADTGIAGPI